MIVDTARTFHSSESVLFITDLNNASLLEKKGVSDRGHVAYLICDGYARVRTKSVKIDQSEGIPDLFWYTRNLLLFRVFPREFLRFLSPRFFLLFRELFSVLHPNKRNAWKRLNFSSTRHSGEWLSKYTRQVLHLLAQKYLIECNLRTRCDTTAV